MRNSKQSSQKHAGQLVEVKGDSLRHVQGGRCTVADDGYIIPDCMLSQAQLAYRNAVRANTKGHHR